MALILAVDSNGLRGASLERLRKALGSHQLTVAESPTAAFAAIDRRLPDVVLLSAALPEPDAGQLCTYLQQAASRRIPVVTLPEPEDEDGSWNVAAVAAQVERELRAPVVAAARALVAWVHKRQVAWTEAPLHAPAAAGGGAAASGRRMFGIGEEAEAEPAAEPRRLVGPALAAFGRGAGSAAGMVGRGLGSLARTLAPPLIRWGLRGGALVVVIVLIGFAGVRARPYLSQWIEQWRSRAVAADPAPEPAGQPPAAETPPPNAAPPTQSPAPPPASAAASPAAPADPTPGWVAVFAPFEISASEKGRGLRIDERNEIMLAPGPHDLTFRNERFGFQEVQHVIIEPAKTVRLSIIPPRSTISISASAPAEVWLDGVDVGQTPLLDLPADLGTRELLLRTADGVERRRVVSVTVAPVAVDVDFSQP